MIKKNTHLNYDYIELTATEAQVRASKEFAPKYAESVLEEYARRGQADLNTIIQQAIPSKIFEYMVYNYLLQQGHCTSPDIRIYGADDKSFDADLTFVNKAGLQQKIHVKSQDIYRIRNREMLSWGFQARDQLYVNPKKYDFVYAGVMVSPTEGHLLIKKVASSVMPYAGDPLKASLRSNKKFLYYQDIAHLNPLGLILKP